MANSIIKYIYKKLYNYTFFRKMTVIAGRTPMYAVHWYTLLAFGMILVVIQTAIAWVTFNDILYKTSDNGIQSSRAVVIRRDSLNNVIKMYDARRVELKNLEKNAPPIIDLGR